MNLMHRGHEYTLSHIRTTQLKNTFVNRCLFSMVLVVYVLLSVNFTLVINDELTFTLFVCSV